jgi:hypothetical protein
VCVCVCVCVWVWVCVCVCVCVCVFTVCVRVHCVCVNVGRLTHDGVNVWVCSGTRTRLAVLSLATYTCHERDIARTAPHSTVKWLIFRRVQVCVRVCGDW